MKIKVCVWWKCLDNFSEYIVLRLKNDKKRFNLKNVEIEEVGCMWKCNEWPNLSIWKEIFTRLNPLKASEILNKKLKEKNESK